MDGHKNPEKPQNLDSVLPEASAPKPKISAKILFLGFLGFGFGLLLIFYGLLLWGLFGGDLSNPLFETLGIEAGDFQYLLLLITNSVFGLLALFFLVAALVKIFQFSLSDKNAANRKIWLKKFGVFSSVFLVVCGTWVAAYYFISNANVAKRDNLTDSLVITSPQVVIGLTAPVKVEFDIGTKLFDKINRQNIRQINWDFDGDGEVDASGPRVSHRFLNKGASNGRFPVQVQVFYFSPTTQKENKFTTTREVIISNEAVSAVITASETSGFVPLEVNFSALESKDPDGNVVFYEWDLNDDDEFEISGENATTAQKVFSEIGQYKVKLRVTGSNNDVSVAEQVISVNPPNENLRAEISTNAPIEGQAPLKLTFDGSNSFVKIGQIVKYQWQVQGEKDVFVGRKIDRVFRNPGFYKVTLVVENDLGERSQASKIVKVLEKPQNVSLDIRTTPAVDESEITTGTVPLQVSFDASGSDVSDVVQWEWDFQNDGISDAFSSAAQYTFRTPGEYEVRLLVSTSGGQSFEKIQKVVARRAGINAKIVAEPPSGSVPLTVDFDASSSFTDRGNIIDYVWEFPGSAPIHYSAQISYEFQKVGVFPVRLTILSDVGESDSTELLVSVRSQPLRAEFEAFPTAGSAPLLVQFNPTYSSGTVSEYLWDFGDGGTSDKFRPSHRFTDPGDYEVKLKIKSPSGIISETTKMISVLE